MFINHRVKISPNTRRTTAKAQQYSNNIGNLLAVYVHRFSTESELESSEKIVRHLQPLFEHYGIHLPPDKLVHFYRASRLATETSASIVLDPFCKGESSHILPLHLRLTFDFLRSERSRRPFLRLVINFNGEGTILDCKLVDFGKYTRSCMSSLKET